jgi:hypothetical protein
MSDYLNKKDLDNNGIDDEIDDLKEDLEEMQEEIINKKLLDL